MSKFLHLFLSLALFIQTDSARILAVFPLPLISHQGVHRSIIQELVNRDHEVVLITPLPEYPRGESPLNLMEIDVSNVTKEIWKEIYVKDDTGQNNYTKGDLKSILQVAAKVVEKQFQIPEIKSFIANNETFDLLLLDGSIRPVLFWTYIFDAPVISVSATFNDYINLGLGFKNPLLYPSYRNEVDKLSVWKKIMALYEHWKLKDMYSLLEEEENEMARRLFGTVPPIKEQMGRIEMLLLDTHPIWQGVRPMPKNVVQLGGTLTTQDRTQITQEVHNLLGYTPDGLIYVNFGDDMHHCIPEHSQRKLIQAFGMLKCPVMWKWDENISELPENVKIKKWAPQPYIIKHRHTRLFITQCDQKSIDEAIVAAIPILAVPLAPDQWRNAEQVLRHNLGIVIDLETVTAEELRNKIELTMRNTSYFVNIQLMSTLRFDAPASAPVQAANAIEYVLRHGAGLIASPTLHIHWFQYMEIELFFIVIIFVCIFSCLLCVFAYCILRFVKRYINRRLRRDTYKNKVQVLCRNIEDEKA